MPNSQVIYNSNLASLGLSHGYHTSFHLKPHFFQDACCEEYSEGGPRGTHEVARELAHGQPGLQATVGATGSGNDMKGPPATRMGVTCNKQTYIHGSIKNSQKGTDGKVEKTRRFSI